MEDLPNQNLFLIEFLVASIYLEPKDVDYIGEEVGTCVTVQFLDNDPLTICEEDFSPKQNYIKQKTKLKTGKSCLFSLASEKIPETIDSFDVVVEIYKKNASGEKFRVGTTTVSVASTFKKLIKTFLAISRPDVCPVTPSETLRDDYDVVNFSGRCIGEINMYIRISSFGERIVTRFQCNFREKSIMFRDKEGNSTYEYKKPPKELPPCAESCPAGGRCGIDLEEDNPSTSGSVTVGGRCGGSTCAAGGNTPATAASILKHMVETRTWGMINIQHNPDALNEDKKKTGSNKNNQFKMKK